MLNGSFVNNDGVERAYFKTHITFLVFLHTSLKTWIIIYTPVICPFVIIYVEVYYIL